MATYETVRRRPGAVLLLPGVLGEPLILSWEALSGLSWLPKSRNGSFFGGNFLPSNPCRKPNPALRQERNAKLGIVRKSR